MEILVQQHNDLVAASDLMVYGVHEHAAEENSSKLLRGVLRRVDQSLDGILGQVAREESFLGEEGQVLMLHTHHKLAAKRIVVIGLGPQTQFAAEKLRRLAATAIVQARLVHAKKVVFSLESMMGQLPLGLAAQALAEGALLANYHFTKYQEAAERKKVQESLVESGVLLATARASLAELRVGVEIGKKSASAVLFCRDLVNEPPVVMQPRNLVHTAQALGRLPGVKVTIYDEKKLQQMNMGGLLAVAAGSEESAYLIHLSYVPHAAAKRALKNKNSQNSRSRKKYPKIALCGKGITFDSGGLSLKPTNLLEFMKVDMAGAATILGLFSQIAALQPMVEVHGVITAAENMPSGKAARPGDIITAYNGKTIEIMNTDAEGRLILADALSWIEAELRPDLIIDVATLTGAAIVALGQEVAAIMGNDQKLLKQVQQAGAATGERLWELPLVDEYEELLESDVADIKNVAKERWAGAIMGALFLRSFIKKTPWAHIDIAGPAWVERPILPYAPFGATGFGVRTLVQFLLNYRGLELAHQPKVVASGDSAKDRNEPEDPIAVGNLKNI